MCGISGFIDVTNSLDPNSVRACMRESIKSLKHRGPDDIGEWASRDSKVYFAHARLAIIDLSELGHQPMTSRHGKWTVCFNGEIYNFKDIKRRLQNLGSKFNGLSDTEVLVESLSHYGVSKTLQLIEGMFAFAAYDETNRKVYLVRDRLGQKPLYFFLNEKFLGFGSELKAIKKLPRFDNHISEESICQFIRFGFIPSPDTIYTGTKQLDPASYLEIDLSNLAMKRTQYWSLKKNHKYSLSYEEAKEETQQLLTSAVEKRMISDVQIGAFLSGGIDSAITVSLMQKLSSSPVNTFTIGSECSQYNEANIAKRISDYLGTNHTEYYLSELDLLSTIPSLCDMYDEPFADSSQIPTAIISRLARQKVTVALTGDGGDEAFCGYNRHVIAPAIHSYLSKLPTTQRTLLAAALKALPPKVTLACSRFLSYLTRGRVSIRYPVEKIDKITHILQVRNSDIYTVLASVIQNPHDYVKIQSNSHKNFSQPLDLQLRDIEFYLPNDVLTKVDRASMASSLEVRSPFLDHKVMEFGYSLPEQYKIKGKQGKAILRDLLTNHIPEEITSLPKAGFSIPLDRWLRGPLEQWAGDLISSMDRSVFHLKTIHQLFEDHRKMASNNQHQLWNLLMFESWRQAQL